MSIIKAEHIYDWLTQADTIQYLIIIWLSDYEVLL